MKSSTQVVSALLLETLPGDPMGLTKTWKAQGNGRPPLVWKGPMGWNSGPPYLLYSALPLWWNGELVPMGWDVVRRFLLENTESDQLQNDLDIEGMLRDFWPDLRSCRAVAEQMVNLNFISKFIELRHDSFEGLVEINGRSET